MMSSRKRNTKCSNCGRFGHYSDRCPNQAAAHPAVTCHKCHQIGHYADSCTLFQAVSSNQVTCHKCQQSGHYAAECPNQAVSSQIASSNQGVSHKTVICYNCHQPGHHRDKCPNQAVSHKTVICYNCHQPGHHRDKCPEMKSAQLLPQNIPNNNALDVKPILSKKVYKIGIKFDGYWGKRHDESCGYKNGECTCVPFAKSAYLHPDCEAFKIKKAFTNRLIESRYVSDADMDLRNQIPHIQVRKYLSEGDTTYVALNGRVLEVSLSSFNIHDNLKTQSRSISFDVGMGKHMTLFHSKTQFYTRMDKNMIITILAEILSTFEIKEPESEEAEPGSEAKQPESKEKEENEDKICKACMEVDRDAFLEPCGHICICLKCAARLTNCPVCRKTITASKKAFLS